MKLELIEVTDSLTIEFFMNYYSSLIFNNTLDQNFGINDLKVQGYNRCPEECNSCARFIHDELN